MPDDRPDTPSDEPDRPPSTQETASLSPTGAESIQAAADAARADIPERIGNYRILRRIGVGGMGAVYEAEQDNPRRIVALKVINPGFASAQLLKRFEFEAQILGRLQHPGLAQILEAGTFDSGAGAQPFFAMELVRGVPLDKYANQAKLGTRQRLELIRKICEAVHHAHQRGIIHRDLKPNNILVTDDGEPKVLDFGVARATDSDIQTSMLGTDIGQLVGTIPYMSPEQAAGDPEDIDTRSDVYALGVLCYELLAGRLPYDLERKMQLEALRIIREDDPTPLSSINKVFRGDVEIIVGKALEKEKARRYQSALDLAGDIHRYLNNEPIVARPQSTWYQARKFARRHRGLVAGLALTFVTLVLGIVGTTWQRVQATTQRDLARDARDHADEQRQFAETMNDFLISTIASPAPDADGRDVKVLDVLNRAVPTIDEQFADYPGLRIQLHETFGSMYRALNLYDLGETRVRHALETARAEVPDDLAQVASLLSTLGVVLLDEGRTREALACFVERRTILGQSTESTVDLAELHVELAGIAHDFGDYDSSEYDYRRGLDLHQRLEPESMDVARVMTSLASLLGDAGRVEEARAMATEALRIRRDHLGADEDGIELAFGLLILGYVQMLDEDYASALESYRAARDMYLRLHKDPEVFMVRLVKMDLAGLVDVAERAGVDLDLRDADEREGGEAFFLDNAPFIIAFSLRNRARYLLRIGQTDAANDFFRRSIEASRDTPDRPMIESHTRRVWATGLRERGRPDEARSHAQAALELQEASFQGDARHALAATLIELARIELAAGNADEALSAAQTALDVRRQGFDADAMPVALAEVIVAECLIAADQHDQADSLLEHALPVLRDAFGPDHEMTRNAESIGRRVDTSPSGG